MSQFQILEDEFGWVSPKAVETILKKTGTDYYQSNGLDKIYSEKTITSKTLGWGGTMDLFIDHSSNIYSIFDLKTGAHFRKMWETSFLKYGNTPELNLFDNARNRAKLQIMLYALMIKAENPEAKFRKLELIHIINKKSLTEDDARAGVDVPAFLHVIKNTLKNENKRVWQQLEALPHFNKLFDPAEYVTTSSSEIETSFPNADSGIILKLKILELESLVMQGNDLNRNIKLTDYESKIRYEKISKLMEEIIKLQNDPKTNMQSFDTDMAWMERWIGSPTSSTNPYVRLYYKHLNKAKTEHRKEYSKWRAKFDAVLKALIKSKGLDPATTVIGGINREKLYDGLLKQVGEGEDLIERFVTEKDKAEWSKLSKEQQNFLTFVNESIAQFFVDEKSDYVDPATGKRVAMANRVVTYRTRYGKEVPITNLDLHNNAYDRSNFSKQNEKFKYYEGFLPKVAPTMEDVRAKHGFFSAEMGKFLKAHYLTNYFEANYEGLYSSEEAIPIKYLGNNKINATMNYSHNLEMAVDSFVKQSLYKQHLDGTYAFGKAMQVYLEAKENTDQGIFFENLIDWFEDSVPLHVLGQKAKTLKVSQREFGVIKDDKYMEFNTIKFLRSLKNFFAGPTMWLKPVTGTINAVFANLVTIKEAVRNSIPGWHAGSNFTISDLAYGYSEALKLYTVDALSENKFRQNKAFLLMERFGYMPDSFDWYTVPNQLLTAKNKLFTTRTMMMFHTLPEEVLATAIFVAQLKAMKFTKTDGTKTNIWDSYSDPKPTSVIDNVTAYTVEWEGGVRGKRNTSNLIDKPLYEDVTELTAEEIAHTKFLYEKIHGGYRADERVAAEYHIWGEMILQLKKYFPSVLKNIWASRGIRETQGYFKETTDEHGEKVLKWTPEVIEGRYRMLFGMFFHYMGVLGKTNGDNSKFLNFFGYQADHSYA